MFRIAAIVLLFGAALLSGCTRMNEAEKMRAMYEAQGWEFLEHVGVPTSEAAFMASMSTNEMSLNATVTALGVDGANRVEKKYTSEKLLYLVAGFQSSKSGTSYCMVFKRPRPTEERWWSIWMTAGKKPVEEVMLKPGEHKTLHISESGTVYVGILVKEALTMKRALEEKGDDSSGVYLTQNVSGKYVGTYHSASIAFDLSSGREFKIENRSPVLSEVMVYLDPAP